MNCLRYLPCHSNSQQTTSLRHNTQTRVSTHCTIQLRNPLSKCLMPTSEVCRDPFIYGFNSAKSGSTRTNSRTHSSRKSDIRARTYNAYFLLNASLCMGLLDVINYNMAFFLIFVKYFNISRHYVENRKVVFETRWGECLLFFFSLSFFFLPKFT
jgi:hypothetical protein